MKLACPVDVNSSLGMAVCLVGFVRTLADISVYKPLVEAFHSQAELVDFYGVVSSSGNDTAKGQLSAVTRVALAPALQELSPLAWEDIVDPPGPPKCNLQCMRQFDKLFR